MGMNVHIALYKWKSNVSEEEISQALRDVEALAPKVPGIIEISTAKNLSKYSEGYSHVILVRGNTQAAIDAYRAHPDHVAVADKIDSMEDQGIGVDFET
jgi:heme-degrading monooxygenase HmoA